LYSIFSEFAKAFDRINHNVLLRNFLAYDFPSHIAWSMSVWQERKQFVDIKNSIILVLWLYEQAVTPQDTRSAWT
jgi:hypothetical protein